MGMIALFNKIVVYTLYASLYIYCFVGIHCLSFMYIYIDIIYSLQNE